MLQINWIPSQLRKSALQSCQFWQKSSADQDGIRQAKLGRDEKQRGQDSGARTDCFGIGGARFHRGSANHAIEESELELREEDGRKSDCRQGSETRFAGFTPSQVDQLFAVFKGRQNQEKVERMR